MVRGNLPNPNGGFTGGSLIANGEIYYTNGNNNVDDPNTIWT